MICHGFEPTALQLLDRGQAVDGPGIARLAKADDALARAVRLAPDAPDTLVAQGWLAYLGHHDYARATAEFEKASGILGGLLQKLRAKPEPYLDRVTMDTEGLDAAARDFLAGMTDRYAVALFEELFVPRSWNV